MKKTFTTPLTKLARIAVSTALLCCSITANSALSNQATDKQPIFNATSSNYSKVYIAGLYNFHPSEKSELEEKFVRSATQAGKTDELEIKRYGQESGRLSNTFQFLAAANLGFTTTLKPRHCSDCTSNGLNWFSKSIEISFDTSVQSSNLKYALETAEYGVNSYIGYTTKSVKSRYGLEVNYLHQSNFGTNSLLNSRNVLPSHSLISFAADSLLGKQTQLRTFTGFGYFKLLDKSTSASKINEIFRVSDTDISAIHSRLEKSKLSEGKNVSQATTSKNSNQKGYFQSEYRWTSQYPEMKTPVFAVGTKLTTQFTLGSVYVSILGYTSSGNFSFKNKEQGFEHLTPEWIGEQESPSRSIASNNPPNHRKKLPNLRPKEKKSSTHLATDSELHPFVNNRDSSSTLKSQSNTTSFESQKNPETKYSNTPIIEYFQATKRISVFDASRSSRNLFTFVAAPKLWILDLNTGWNSKSLNFEAKLSSSIFVLKNLWVSSVNGLQSVPWIFDPNRGLMFVHNRSLHWAIENSHLGTMSSVIATVKANSWLTLSPYAGVSTNSNTALLTPLQALESKKHTLTDLLVSNQKLKVEESSVTTTFGTSVSVKLFDSKSKMSHLSTKLRFLLNAELATTNSQVLLTFADGSRASVHGKQTNINGYIGLQIEL